MQLLGGVAGHGIPTSGFPLLSRQAVNTSTVAEVREREERRAAAKSGK